VTTRYVIIGSSIAGLAAAEAIRAADRAGEITLVSDDPHGYYSRPGLAYLLTGEIPQAQLFSLREADWRALGLRRVTGEVTRLEPDAHQVVLADGARLPYDRSHAFPLDHGESGVSSCKTCHPDQLKAYTCYGCHEHTPADIQRKHVKEGIPDFANCMKCHPTGREKEGAGGKNGD